MEKTIDYTSPILVGCTLVPWKCEKNEHLDWLKNSLEIKNKFSNIKFFVSLEVDSRGLNPFLDVLRMLGAIGGEYWTFNINDHRKKVTSQNRWIRMETGRNLIREFAQDGTWPEDGREPGPITKYSSILYIDSDIELKLEHLEKMLKIDSPIVGVDIPKYKLNGNASIAMLLINAPAYYDLPFYHNKYEMINDDKKFIKTAEEKYGKIYVINDIDLNLSDEYLDIEYRDIPDRVYN